MTKYHVGCGIAGIYAGTLNKSGTMWVNKSDVTDEVMRFTYHDKHYILCVELEKSEGRNEIKN